MSDVMDGYIPICWCDIYDIPEKDGYQHHTEACNTRLLDANEPEEDPKDGTD